MVGGYNRYVSKKKALRKKRINNEVYWDGKEYPYYNNLHQYSKNKIHCSCPLCRAKTRNKGRGHGLYSPSINYSISDKRKIDKLEYNEND